jgi:hypothetical protein
MRTLLDHPEHEVPYKAAPLTRATLYVMYCVCLRGYPSSDAKDHTLKYGYAHAHMHVCSFANVNKRIVINSQKRLTQSAISPFETKGTDCELSGTVIIMQQIAHIFSEECGEKKAACKMELISLRTWMFLKNNREKEARPA